MRGSLTCTLSSMDTCVFGVCLALVALFWAGHQCLRFAKYKVNKAREESLRKRGECPELRLSIADYDLVATVPFVCA